MTEHNTFEPGWASPPGDTIADILEEKQITATDFAQRIGQTSAHATDVLHGRAEITTDLANQLAEVLGSTATFRINRENQYREDIARLQNQLSPVVAQKFVRELPVNEMIQLGWLHPTQDATEKAIACLRFFGVPDIKSWREHYTNVFQIAFRTSPSFESDFAAVAAWVRQGELAAASIDCAAWNLERFRAALPDIRKLTREKEPHIFLSELQKRCACHGVAVVIVQAPNKCRASGAVRILPRNRRLILLSFRYLSDDHFWFTFFHEAGHLILHGDVALLLEGVNAISDIEENEANEFAANILVPPKDREKMLALPVDGKAVMRFAKDIGVSPGIIVGQLQHFGRLTQKQLNKLKKRYKWEMTEHQS